MTTATKPKLRAALYIRVSTEEQGEKFGEVYQEKEMRKALP